MSSFHEFLDDVGRQCASPERSFIFRGQANGDWPLTSSFHRYCARKGVAFSSGTFLGLLDPFIERASDFLSQDLRSLDLWEKMALAQHHGIPTPLIDWSGSPYIAAFFALADAVERARSRKAKVFGLDIGRIASLRCEDATPAHEWLFAPANCFGVVRTRLFQSKRVMRQMGLFTLFTEAGDLGSFLRRRESVPLIEFEIDLRSAERDLRELALMGVTASTLFDSLDGVAVDVLNRS